MKNFTYEMHYNSGRTKALTYDEALDIVLGYYKDNDMSRDMLKVGNCIIIKPIGYLRVYEETKWGKMTLMAGWYNNLPSEFSYDDDGNHIS